VDIVYPIGKGSTWQDNELRFSLIHPVTANYKQDTYYESLKNTVAALESKGHGTLHFDIHTPIIYNKKLFNEVMAEYDWSIPYGYAIKSLYANTLNLPGEQIGDMKISRPYAVPKIKRLLEDRTFFSVSPKGLNQHMKTFLKYQFPDKSRYEN
jgi:hypothetical protein